MLPSNPTGSFRWFPVLFPRRDITNLLFLSLLYLLKMTVCYVEGKHELYDHFSFFPSTFKTYLFLAMHPLHLRPMLIRVPDLLLCHVFQYHILSCLIFTFWFLFSLISFPQSVNSFRSSLSKNKNNKNISLTLPLPFKLSFLSLSYDCHTLGKNN